MSISVHCTWVYLLPVHCTGGVRTGADCTGAPHWAGEAAGAEEGGDGEDTGAGATGIEFFFVESVKEGIQKHYFYGHVCKGVGFRQHRNQSICLVKSLVNQWRPVFRHIQIPYQLWYQIAGRYLHVYSLYNLLSVTTGLLDSVVAILSHRWHKKLAP